MRSAVGAESLIATEHLDRVDELPVGSGHLDLSVFGRDGIFGGTLGYDHRVRDDLSLFAEGWAGYDGDLHYGASAGLRWRF